MSKSFCIKTNNNKIITELISEIEKINLSNLYISQKKFAIYENLIIHYLGDNIEMFENSLAKAISNIIVNSYQKAILNKIITENYFYFFDYERTDILNTCIENIDEFDIVEQYQSIYKVCLSYINENKSMILDGFVRFRLYDYTNMLDEVVDYSISKYLVQREYLEFVRLLREYISTTQTSYSRIHLIYSSTNVVLLDENNIIIPIENNISNAKFLSDISFSKNDYCLNTLLTILPEEIKLHLLSPEDEFIETIKLIFADRITVCKSCELCSSQKHANNSTLI